MIEFITAVKDIIWGPPLLIALLGTGVFYTLSLRFLPWRKIPFAFAQLFAGRKSTGDGDITAFQALMTSLSATVGTGNIVGVAAAIGLGGPGALFWMWITALLGMSLKYAEAVLGVHYRVIDANGDRAGGPMYYIRNGLGENWKWLAGAFAFFGAFAGFGLGNTVQANSVADILRTAFGFSELWVGLIIAALVGLVILGGLKSIAKTASALVPTMAISYLVICFIVIGANITALPDVISLIVSSAFTNTAAQGGFAGGAIMLAIQVGVSRGIFSNEAGMGSAPIAHAAAKTDSPVRQGIIAMLGTFIDTLVICSLTGFVILLTGFWNTGAEGAAMTAGAFGTMIPHADKIIAVIMVLLAFTTMLGWSYYSERCFAYLFGERRILIFRLMWVLVIPFGATLSFGIIWTIADILNGLMAFPNLIALLFLSPVVMKLTKAFFDDLNNTAGNASTVAGADKTED